MTLELDLHQDAGAVLGILRGVERPRHYGDPAGEYEAAVTGAGVIDRSFRRRLEVTGAAPVQMLGGVLSGAIPPGPREVEGGPAEGRATYSTILTPKGRMISDLRVLRLDRVAAVALASSPTPSVPPGGLPARNGGSGGERLLLDVPAEGAEAVLQHFGRVLPPRFASVDDVTERSGMLTVLGPESAKRIANDAFAGLVTHGAIEGLEEWEYLLVDDHDRDPVFVIRTRDVATDAFDVLGERSAIRRLWIAIRDAGARAVGSGVWETLRVEAGRPAFGVDMDDTTIPIEAGIDAVAIDHTKGCYTGQEVIVRIRDRGHVNRHLRGLRLGESPTPPPGTEVFVMGSDTNRPVGRICSSVHSPRMGETVALAYLRREVSPGDQVRIAGGEATGLVSDLGAAGGPWGP